MGEGRWKGEMKRKKGEQRKKYSPIKSIKEFFFKKKKLPFDPS